MADLDRKSQGLGDRPALLLIDMIESFTDPDCPLGSEADDVVEANRRLLDTFRERGLPVAYTTVVYHDERQARVFRDRVPALELLKPGTRWVNIDPRLAPRSGEPVFEKQWASAFFRTGLDEYLRGQGVDSLVVTGLTTSGCVRASAVDGLQHDYRVVVPREAVGDRNEEAHQANLFDLNAKYADVLDLNEVLDMIGRL
ncbi:MAG: isochorismatase family protein [Lysobacterales bacterium]|jgi:nicotinamidase-related amidase